MVKQRIFNFKTDISGVNIPEKLNNPFEVNTSEIALIAVREFQEFITTAAPNWSYDFQLQKGKMFGVLVVQQENGSHCYIGTVSGNLTRNNDPDQFIPSVFDDTTAEDFINKGMTELTALSNTINQTVDQVKVLALSADRKSKSLNLQQRLFENYRFSNILGAAKNVKQIFEDSARGNPPAAAGDCAAPKLLQYAFEHQLQPIALAEFWWGNPPKNRSRVHKALYPACKDKCRPILEFMLDDQHLFDQVRNGFEVN